MLPQILPIHSSCLHEARYPILPLGGEMHNPGYSILPKDGISLMKQGAEDPGITITTLLPLSHQEPCRQWGANIFPGLPVDTLFLNKKILRQTFSGVMVTLSSYKISLK